MKEKIAKIEKKEQRRMNHVFRRQREISGTVNSPPERPSRKLPLSNWTNFPLRRETSKSSYIPGSGSSSGGAVSYFRK